MDGDFSSGVAADGIGITSRLYEATAPGVNCCKCRHLPAEARVEETPRPLSRQGSLRSERKTALCVRCDFLVLDGRGLGVGLADVDAALEEGTVFNADAGRGDVTGERAFCTDVDAIRGSDIAL